MFKGSEEFILQTVPGVRRGPLTQVCPELLKRRSRCRNRNGVVVQLHVDIQKQELKEIQDHKQMGYKSRS